MANSSKRKGDRAEREALAAICRLAPDLVVPRPQRLLGAGRREDTGDLWVLPGVTVQVKCRADPADAIRPAADAAAVQARRAGNVVGLGLVPIPRARCGSVRWVACGAHWPCHRAEGATVFSSVTAALHHVRRDDEEAPERTSRVAVVRRAPTAAVYLGTLEAWLSSFRFALGGAVSSPPRSRPS